MCSSCDHTHPAARLLAPNPNLRHFATLTLIKDFLSAFLSLGVNFCHPPVVTPSQPPLSHAVCSHARLFFPEDPAQTQRPKGGHSRRPAAMAAAMVTTASRSAPCGPQGERGTEWLREMPITALTAISLSHWLFC